MNYRTLIAILISFHIIRTSNNAYGSDEHEEKCTVKVFNVGQGNAIGIRYEYKEGNDRRYETMLIDAGSTYLKPRNGQTTTKRTKILKKIKEFVRGNKETKDLTTVKAVVVTHAHDDHFNLLAEIFENYDKSIENLILSGAKEVERAYDATVNSIKTNKILYTRSIKTKSKGGKKLTTIEEEAPEAVGELLKFTPKTNTPTINVLSLNGGSHTTNKNDDSIVLQLLCAQTLSILLTGDATKETWKKVVELGNTHSHILLFPHHGSKREIQCSYGSIISIIKPSVCIFSAGLQPRFKHPTEEAFVEARKYALIEDHPISLTIGTKEGFIPIWNDQAIFSTADHGDITITVEGAPITTSANTNEKPFLIMLEDKDVPVIKWYDEKNKKPMTSMLSSRVTLEEKAKLAELIKSEEGSIIYRHLEDEKAYAYSRANDPNVIFYLIEEDE
ncbi:MAG: hypothetical protein BGO76_00150 [Caedibacter sp. 38-128]|nr:MAG: hypothetical protein BGO76_00150 [Caedibacter sp. 38-128]